MYSVSNAYLEQMMKRGTRRRLSGTIGNIAFTGNDVVRDSFSITSRAAEESDTKIGGVYLSQLEMTFVPSFITKIPRDQYRGQVVTISIGLWLPDEEAVGGGTWENVPCGTFTLEAPKISKQGISVTGYDNMAKLDKKFAIDQTSATPYAFLSYMATECNVALAQTEGEIQALPNGTETLGIYEQNDIETFRDLLYWLAQTLGCFACADRQGKIALRKFGVPNDISIYDIHRDNDVVFSGYTTKWTGISFVDIETQMTRYYGLEVDDGLTMNMGANPLLQLGTADAIERRRRAVLNAVAQIQYTPFYVNSARDPIFDLGDEINFLDGISGDCTGCVMALVYSLDGYNFEGYGDDPSLANARSKTDKNIAGLMQNTVENEVTYYNFVNLEDIILNPEVETLVSSIRFTSSQLTTIKVLQEFILDFVMDSADGGSYEVHYYLDGELQTYKPYESLGIIEDGDEVEFSIARDLFYILKEVEPNVAHVWQTKIITHGASATIETGNAHVTIEGQRLYGEDYFDGYIEITEDVTYFDIGSLGVGDISETVVVTTINAVVPVGSDNFTEIPIASLGVGDITDTLQVFMEGGFYIATEDGKIITTEDSKGIITE